MSQLRLHPALTRLDAARLRLDSPAQVPATLFARPDVPVEPEAVCEALAFLSTQEDLARAGLGRIERLVLTPDFHRGSGIPVGTVARTQGCVLPRAVGSDVYCGMRLVALDARGEELDAALPRLAPPLREVFFGGRRDLPTSPAQREALLLGGLPALLGTSDNWERGSWRWLDVRRERADLARAHFSGGIQTSGLFVFADWVRGSGSTDGRDAQLGSIGGGNHFVEFQVVEEIFDGPTAESFGLRRGQVVVMVHSGSVGFGHAVGGHFADRARALWPAGLPHPASGFYALGAETKEAREYLAALALAANFAFGNRLVLGLLAARALSEVLGRPVSSKLVSEAPHNFVWSLPGGAFLHRKGACPAPGPDLGDGPFAYTGWPVVVPGSMGAPSYVLAGQGSEESMQSACHGAGRRLSRGQAAQMTEEEFGQEIAPLHVVTPLDAEAPATRLRRDVLAEHRRRLKEEAPRGYKDVGPVVQTIEDANIARRIARLGPRITVKG